MSDLREDSIGTGGYSIQPRTQSIPFKKRAKKVDGIDTVFPSVPTGDKEEPKRVANALVAYMQKHGGPLDLSKASSFVRKHVGNKSDRSVRDLIRQSNVAELIPIDRKKPPKTYAMRDQLDYMIDSILEDVSFKVGDKVKIHIARTMSRRTTSVVGHVVEILRGGRARVEASDGPTAGLTYSGTVVEVLPMVEE